MSTGTLFFLFLCHCYTYWFVNLSLEEVSVSWTQITGPLCASGEYLEYHDFSACDGTSGFVTRKSLITDEDRA